MQYALIAAALVAAATASADVYSFNNNATCKEDQPYAKIVNRCPYTVHVWSVLKGTGCPEGEGAVVPPGGYYAENFRPAVGGVGTSIKVSKTEACTLGSIVQLEYFLETGSEGGMYDFNYLDVSYVDCGNEDCPTKQEGYYLKSGNENGQFMANAVNEICPILSCDGPESCAECSYILPDDRQTKSCNLKANLNFYMCGGEAPGSDDSYSAPPASSPGDSTPSSTEVYEEPAAPTSAAAYEEVAAAEVTPAPQPANPANVKTEYVYTTVFVKEKRHAHGHRHQHFRA